MKQESLLGLADSVVWLRRQGYRVTQTESSHWYNAAPGVLQAFPYHMVIQPSERELAQLMVQERAVGLRYSTCVDAPVGLISYHVVNCDNTYVLNDLSKKARYDVRRGLAHATVDRVPVHRLATDGWQLRAETLARQGRLGAESEEWWRRLCLSADGLPSFDAWAAVHQGQMVASLLGLRIGDCYSILYQQSLSEHMRHAVNNALAFVATKEALERSHVSQIFYGLQSLDAAPTVDQFKFRMGFVPKPVRQRVLFHTWLSPFANRLSHAVLQRLLREKSAHPMLAKAEGLIRFYVEGKRSLESQTWPEYLQNYQKELLHGEEPRCA